MVEGTTQVITLDLRDGAAADPDVAGGVLVIDRADAVAGNAAVYEALVRAKRVSGVMCLVLGEDPAASGGAAVLSLPHVLRYATVLWIGDARGVDWAPGGQRVVPVGLDDPETLARLIEALQVPEVFDRVRATSGEVHGLIASPGLRVVRGGVPIAELAEARAASIQLLTAPMGSRPPGDDASTVVLRAGGAADPAPAPVSSTSRLGRAADSCSRGLDRVDSLARALGSWQAVLGRNRSTEDVGSEVTKAGELAENYRLGLIMLLDRMDGHLLIKDPPAEKVVELGVPPPVEGRPMEATAGLREFVTRRLRGGGSLPGLATELRRAADLAAPQGCTTVLERIRSHEQLTLDMPVFRRFPLALWTILLAVLTCAAVGFALGPGWPGRIAGAVLALVWAGSGWLLLARRPAAETEVGLRAAAPVALPLYGLPALVGAAVGIAGALLLPVALRPAPLTLQLLVVAGVLVTVVTPVLCWRSAVRLWRRKLAAAALRATVDQLASDADEVIKREWQLVERRRAVQHALEVVAAGLEEIGNALRTDGDRLFVPELPPRRDAPAGLARAVPPETLDVVRSDLAGIALQSLDQAWIAAESGRRTPGGASHQTLERLLGEYARHVRSQGLITPRADAVLESGARDRLAMRVWSASPLAQAALATSAEDVMTQLCTDDQLDYLSTTTDPVLVRFAPQQVRRVLEMRGSQESLLADSGIVWSAGRELIGAIRLLPVRLDAVQTVHPGGLT
jgi:hypothetical protein